MSGLVTGHLKDELKRILRELSRKLCIDAKEKKHQHWLHFPAICKLAKLWLKWLCLIQFLFISPFKMVFSVGMLKDVEDELQRKVKVSLRRCLFMSLPIFSDLSLLKYVSFVFLEYTQSTGWTTRSWGWTGCKIYINISLKYSTSDRERERWRVWLKWEFLSLLSSASAVLGSVQSC